MLCNCDNNLCLSLEHSNLFVTQHSHGGEEKENQSTMNSVLSHPFSSVPSQVTQTRNWLSGSAVHCKAPSAVLHCIELEDKDFLRISSKYH